MSKILVSGGTGFLGSKLVERLGSLGHEVTVLSRSAESLPTGAAHIHTYTPLAAGEWYRHLNGQDAVVHLAGERAVGVRYTAENKKRILESRVKSTEQLVLAMAKAEQKPKAFLCASAIGYYGSDVGETPVAESSAPGEDFLAGVCVEWEKRARAAEALSVRVVLMRFGVILGAEGGALEAMLKPFRLGVGGKIGSGEQYVSWIHLEDVLGFMVQALADTSLAGPFNLTAPSPSKNRELTQEIGRLLHRPTFFRAPAFALKLAFGEGAAPLLGGRPVLPRRLLDLGFNWKYPDLPSALGNLLD